MLFMIALMFFCINEIHLLGSSAMVREHPTSSDVERACYLDQCKRRGFDDRHPNIDGKRNTFFIMNIIKTRANKSAITFPLSRC